MNEKLKRYMDELFRSAPKDARTAELKEEILQNVSEKYADLIASGRSEDEAYRIAINGIGDLSELISDTSEENPKRDSASKRIIRGVLGAVVAMIVTVLIGALLFPALRDRASAFHAIEQVFTGAGTASTAETASEPAQAARASEGSVPIDGIRALKIEWVAGDVRLSVGAGSEITFAETSDVALTDGQKLVWRVRDGGLTISYCGETEQKWKWLDLDKLHMPRKNLTVTVPVGVLDTFDFEGVSSNVTLDGFEIPETDIETVSGNIRTLNCAGAELEAESVSGNVTVDGGAVGKLDIKTVSGDIGGSVSAKEVELESVSGNAFVNLAIAPYALELESVSGDFTVGLPAQSEFRMTFDTASGDFDNEFAGTKNGKTYTVGGGVNCYEAETISGDVRLVINRG